MLTPLANSLTSTTYSSYSSFLPWCSMTFNHHSAKHSTLFCDVLSLTQQIYSRVYKFTYLYLFSTLDLCNTRIISSLSWVTCSKAWPVFIPSPPCCTRARQALSYFYRSMSYFEGVTILFLDSALSLIFSFCAMSPFLRSLCYAYHHYLLILEPLTFTVCAL